MADQAQWRGSDEPAQRRPRTARHVEVISEDSYAQGATATKSRSRHRRKEQAQAEPLEVIGLVDAKSSRIQENGKAKAEENVLRLSTHVHDLQQAGSIEDQLEARVSTLEDTINTLKTQLLRISKKSIQKSKSGDSIESFPTFSVCISVIRGESEDDHQHLMPYMIKVSRTGDGGSETDDQIVDADQIVTAELSGFPIEAIGWVKSEKAPKGVYIVSERGMCPEFRLYLNLFENKIPFYNEKLTDDRVDLDEGICLKEQADASVVMVCMSYSPTSPDWGMRSYATYLIQIAACNPHVFVVESGKFDPAEYDDEVYRPNYFGPVGEFTDRDRATEVHTLMERFIRMYTATCEESHTNWADCRILSNKANSTTNSVHRFISQNGKNLLSKPRAGAFRRIDAFKWFHTVYEEFPPKTDAAYALYMTFLVSFRFYTLANSCSSATIGSFMVPNKDPTWTTKVFGDANMFQTACTAEKSHCPRYLSGLIDLVASLV